MNIWPFTVIEDLTRRLNLVKRELAKESELVDSLRRKLREEGHKYEALHQRHEAQRGYNNRLMTENAGLQRKIAEIMRTQPDAPQGVHRTPQFVQGDPK